MAAQSRSDARWTEPGLQALWQFFGRRHCEGRSDAAIHGAKLDCFASLAMTDKHSNNA
jgi:hypothetical protein